MSTPDTTVAVNGAAPGRDVVIEKLRVELLDGATVVDDFSLSIRPGEIVALVGESGCGKTATAMALLGYARPGSRISHGRVLIEGRDILALDKQARRNARGRRVAYVPQDPTSALNPAHRIGRQVAEMFVVHGIGADVDLAEEVTRLLELVRLPSSGEFQHRYPHQLSGGQQQRVAIAMALACRPQLIVLDEPTTGLDVTTQRHILDAIGRLRSETNAAFLYVSHDLAVVANLADRVVVMYGGVAAEVGDAATIFNRPRHPYTVQLLRALPRLDARRAIAGIPGQAVSPQEKPAGCPFAPRCRYSAEECLPAVPPLRPVDDHLVACVRTAEVELAAPTPALAPTPRQDTDGAALVVQGLAAHYGLRRRRESPTTVLGDIDMKLHAGECLAIVGESGSGKTTLARCLVGLHRPTSGRISLGGVELAPAARRRTANQRQRLQIVFQNPDASLNPRHTVGQAIARPLELFHELRGATLDERVVELLDLVRLPRGLAARRPFELSGGERQRVAIARALAPDPSVIICDEITSALDVSVQAAILDLLRDLQTRMSISLLFISHDLAVVRAVSDRVLVLRDGQVVEEGDIDGILSAPRADYTRELIAAIPRVPGEAVSSGRPV